jgi:hypothetical protein
MVKEVVLANAVVREPGYLYFVDSHGSVVRSKANRNGRPKKKVNY